MHVAQCLPQFFPPSFFTSHCQFQRGALQYRKQHIIDYLPIYTRLLIAGNCTMAGYERKKRSATVGEGSHHNHLIYLADHSRTPTSNPRPLIYHRLDNRSSLAHAQKLGITCCICHHTQLCPAASNTNATTAKHCMKTTTLTSYHSECITLIDKFTQKQQNTSRCLTNFRSVSLL